MVTQARVLLGAAVVLAAALAGSTCKVVNEDHCANQEAPGNQFCRELNTATPYCSPCRRDYHGCVDYEPFACEGYTNELGEDDGPSESSTGAGSTSEAPGSSDGEPGSSSGEASDGSDETTGTA